MNILVTGANGFVGSHLIDYIINNNLGKVYAQVYGTPVNLDNISHVLNKIKIIECDITDFNAVNEMIAEIKPAKIFHLAAHAFVGNSWKAPFETINTNLIGTLNIFEAVRKNNLNSTIQIASSSETYGFVKVSETPITEQQELRPLSPYGVSKVAMDRLGYQYAKSYGMDIIITRAFNHTGPRRAPVYVASDWAKQIAEIEINGAEPVIKVGNLESYRDFTDVRDIVRAYWLATEKCKPGEPYNICSNNKYQMKWILDTLLAKSDKKIKVAVDESRLRPSDVPLLQGSYTKFYKATKWTPEIQFVQTLDDLLNYWRRKLKRK